MPTYTRAELIANVAEIGLPYAPINKPEDLFTDEHMVKSGGLLDIRLSDGRMSKVPGLPLEINGKRFRIRRQLPKIGEHTAEVLAGGVRGS